MPEPEPGIFTALVLSRCSHCKHYVADDTTATAIQDVADEVYAQLLAGLHAQNEDIA